MPNCTLLSVLDSLACWQSPADPIRLLLAVLLLASSAIGPRLMVGNRGWVRLLIGLAGLSVLPFALLRFGSDCKAPLPPPRPSTAVLLQYELDKINKGKQGPESPQSASCAASVPVAPGTVIPTFYAGPTYLTYDAVLRNLQKKACKHQPPFAFEVINALGTVDTVRVIDTIANAPWGLIQGDAKLFAQWATVVDLTLMGIRSADTKMIERLQESVAKMMVAEPMHLETVHVLTTRSHIRDFANLSGKHVLLPNDSQGSILSAINLFRYNRMPTHSLDATAGGLQQLAKLIDGEADALIITTGAPTPLLEAVAGLPEELRKGLHFVSFAKSQLPPVYSFAPVRYPSWQGAAVQAPAVRALWVSWDFKAKMTPHHVQRCEQTRQLREILKLSLPDLQKEMDAHPAWKSVDPKEPVIGWPLSKC